MYLARALQIPCTSSITVTSSSSSLSSSSSCSCSFSAEALELSLYVFSVAWSWCVSCLNRYQILNPRGIKGVEDAKKASKILIESTELNEDLYRLGHTKAWLSSILNIYALIRLNFEILSCFIYWVDGSIIILVLQYSVNNPIRNDTKRNESCPKNAKAKASFIHHHNNNNKYNTQTTAKQQQTSISNIQTCNLLKMWSQVYRMFSPIEMIQSHLQLSNPESRWHRWHRRCKEVWRSYIGIHRIGSRYVSYWTH